MFHLLNTVVGLQNIPCVLNLVVSRYCQCGVMSHRIHRHRYTVHSLDFMFWDCICRKCRKEKPDHQSSFIPLRSSWFMHCWEFHCIDQIFIVRHWWITGKNIIIFWTFLKSKYANSLFFTCWAFMLLHISFVFALTSGNCELSKLIQEKNKIKKYIKISMFYFECICKHTQAYIHTHTDTYIYMYTYMYIYISIGRGVWKSGPWTIWLVFNVFVKLEWISLDTEMQDNVLIGKGCVSEFFTHSVCVTFLTFGYHLPPAFLFTCNSFLPTQSQYHRQCDRLFETKYCSIFVENIRSSGNFSSSAADRSRGVQPTEF